MSSLLVRVLSALVGLTLIALCYQWMGATGIALLAFTCVLIVNVEYSFMFFKTPAVRFSFLFFASFLLFVHLQFRALFDIFVPLSCIVLTTVTLSQTGKQLSVELALKRISYIFMGLIYCVLFPTYALGILELDRGLLLFLSFLVAVFCGDVVAYFVGKTWGKSKLLEVVSPKKTKLGAIGGLLGSMLGTGLIGLYFEFNPITMAFIGLITGFSAQVGDLFESLMKRVNGLKDSGRIMPGHGGLMDRLDGIYFGAPAFYFLVTALYDYLG